MSVRSPARPNVGPLKYNPHAEEEPCRVTYVQDLDREENYRLARPPEENNGGDYSSTFQWEVDTANSRKFRPLHAVRGVVQMGILLSSVRLACFRPIATWRPN